MAYSGERDVHFIMGKRKSGKTHLAEAMIDRLDCNRIVYYDSNGHDYSDGVICDGLEQFKSYFRRVVDGDFSIVFRTSKPRADFEEVCKIVQAAGKATGDIIFVVDEVDMYFKDGDPVEALGDLIRRGRHDNVELIGITQRPREMGELRSQAGYLYIFTMHEKADLQYFKSFSDTLADMVKQLKQHEYVLVPLPYDEEQLSICKETNEGTTQTKAFSEVDRSQDTGPEVGLQSPDGGTNSQDSEDSG